jgi:hypothetical protein
LLPDGNSAHAAGAVLAKSDLVRKTGFVFDLGKFYRGRQEW